MNDKLKGFPLLYLSSLLFAFSAIAVKEASRFYNSFVISGIRFAVGVFLCVFFILVTRGSLKPVKPKFVLLRGLFGFSAMGLYYLSISVTGAGRATLLTNMYPLFVALSGYLFFREGISLRIIISLLFCAAGSVLVLRDGSGADIRGDILGLLSAVLAGIAVQFLKKGRETDSPFMLYLSPSLMGMIFLVPGIFGDQGFLSEGLILPGLFFILLTGLLAFGAQMLMAYAYKFVPASRGSIVFYLSTCLAVLFAFILGEEMKFRFFLGLVFILTGIWFNGEWKFWSRLPERIRPFILREYRLRFGKTVRQE